MTKWVSAQYDHTLKAATYTDSQSNQMIRTGGSLPWRLNNPGNLRPRMEQGQPAPLEVKSQIGFALTRNAAGEDGYFLIFPDYDTGVNELRNNLKRLYATKSIEQAIYAFAPASENNSQGYLSNLQNLSGLNAKQIVGGLSSGDFEKMVQAIIKIEGYDALPNGPRQEQYQTVYIVQARDTLSKIASKFNTSVQRLQQDNQIANPDKIELRQRLIIRHGSVIQPGFAPWMEIAFSEALRWQGQDETQITKVHNYHKMVYPGRGLPSLAGDANPWCAAFVHYCLKQSGYLPAINFEAANAVILEKTRFAEIYKPVYGAICYTPRKGGGHVCFVVGSVPDGSMIVLGGNQDNQISFEPKSSANARFFLPLSYLELAKPQLEHDLGQIDLDALKARFGRAVRLNASSQQT